ncbi:MAG TPA: hypothetical protein VFB12_14405 [Ktedonobacteraceae bacterium]|nr:hypothetical protein [Ktedonobacteraceae bacterium]
MSDPYRIRLVGPLPHQTTVVVETMLSKQPLCYLLADFSIGWLRISPDCASRRIYGDPGEPGVLLWAALSALMVYFDKKW